MRVELLAKIIASVLPGQRLLAVLAPLHPGGEVEQGEELGGAEVGDGEEVALGHVPIGLGRGRQPNWQEGV